MHLAVVTVLYPNAGDIRRVVHSENQHIAPTSLPQLRYGTHKWNQNYKNVPCAPFQLPFVTGNSTQLLFDVAFVSFSL